MFGLLSLRGKGHMHWHPKNINSQFVIDCLDRLTKSIEIPTVIVLDNAPWHTSNLVKAKLDEWVKKDLHIFYLPPYSPKLNLIEILWRKKKYEWLKPSDFVNPQSLKNAVLNIFENYGSLFNINFSKNFLLSV